MLWENETVNLWLNLEMSISQAAHTLEKLEKSGVFEGARVQFAPKHDLSLAMFANSVSKPILCNLESELLVPQLLDEVLLEPLGTLFQGFDLFLTDR